jgi:hypothetical protein
MGEEGTAYITQRCYFVRCLLTCKYFFKFHTVQNNYRQIYKNLYIYVWVTAEVKQLRQCFMPLVFAFEAVFGSCFSHVALSCIFTRKGL